MKKFRSFLKKNDDKGTDAGIVRVLSYMIFGLCFFTMIDAVVLMVNMATMSYHAMYCAKQLSVSGGLSGTTQVTFFQNRPVTSGQFVNLVMNKAAIISGISSGDLTCTVYSSGLSGGQAEVFPSLSSAEDSGRRAISQQGDWSIARGFSKPQSLEVVFVHKWDFSPILRGLGLETPITLHFNYRSEYIR